MSEVVKTKIDQADVDFVAQEYFRQRQKNLKPSDIEGLIRRFDCQDERDQVVIARRA